MKSAAQLQALLISRSWDKELVLWVGGEKALQDAIGAAKHVVLDLLDLFDPENLPTDEDDTRDQLRERLRTKLKAITHGPNNRIVLIVKSVGLLARYRAGLQEFYNWFVGDFALVILLLDAGHEKFEWPEEVVCEPNRLLGYFSEPGMVKEIFSAIG
ncbi:MAG TPA: hypothetical protein VFC44_26655 [Candidatus Saccharimonadales bacterium]|nr:hypothetical protein [Candidatus Saccharimonadales bacterium]